MLNFVWWKESICRRPSTKHQYCGWTNNRMLMHSDSIMCRHSNNVYSLSMTAIPIYFDTPAFAYHIRIFLMHPGPFRRLQAPKLPAIYHKHITLPVDVSTVPEQCLSKSIIDTWVTVSTYDFNKIRYAYVCDRVWFSAYNAWGTNHIAIQKL